MDNHNPISRWGIFFILLYAIASCVGIFIIASNKDISFSKFWDKTFSLQPKIAVVPIHGVITYQSTGPFDEGTSALKTAKRIRDLARQEDVGAIVLDINSPGGSVGAVQEITDALLAVKASSKVVVASIADVAASGGYYVAAQSDKIFAHPGSITGSIGVLMRTGNVEGLMKKVGVKTITLRSAPHKDIASPFREMVPEEKKILQTIVDEAYDQFLEAVKLGRNMPLDKIKPWADGRVFTGAKAKEVGLVDALGSRQAAILAAAELAKIPLPPKVIETPHGWSEVFSVESIFGKVFPAVNLPKHTLELSYLWEPAQ